MPSHDLIRSIGASLLAGTILTLTSTGALAAECEDPLVTAGKILYEETAGGVGCAICHGPAATGDPDTGAPFIRGVSKAQLDAALDGGVPDMDFFDLKRPEKKALLAYLQSLKDEPVEPETPDNASATIEAVDSECTAQILPQN